MSNKPTVARWGYHDDGRLDELVARNVRYLHFEDMGDGDWWMAVELANGELWHLNFGTKNPRARTYARAERVT